MLLEVEREGGGERGRSCGEGSSLKGNQQLVMNPQEHNRSWKGSAMCLLVCVGVRVGKWCGVVRLFVVLWIVCCCVVGRRRCVVGCVSFIVNALAVASCTNTTCHVNDGSEKTMSIIVHKLHRKVFSITILTWCQEHFCKGKSHG